jgi:hypothetical protein
MNPKTEFFIEVRALRGTYKLFFCKLFFTQEWTPHILRFHFFYTVIIPAAPQETVEEAGIEPGTAALQSGSPSRTYKRHCVQQVCHKEGREEGDGCIIS